MLVPRNRLILCTALVVLPFAALGGAVPATLGVAALALGFFLLAVVFDAVAAPGRLAGIRFELPESVRLQKDRAGVVEVRIHTERPGARTLRVGFGFPREIVPAEAERLVSLPPDVAQSQLEWHCTPAVRGQFFVRHVYLEAISPLGFWAMRTTQPVQAELRVYPDLFSERRKVAALFLRHANAGAHTQRQAGQGREFEKLRDYIPGDSLADIHWKASAKRGKPVTKLHQVERSHEVYVLVDASRLSARGASSAEHAAAKARGADERSMLDAPHSTALERYVSAALLLGVAAEQQGDQFGLVTFSDRVLSFVRARSGQAHFDACRDQLYGLQAQRVSPDFEELGAFLRARLRKRALLIFLTALDDPVLAETFTKAMELLCRQHLILVNMIEPTGAQPLFSEAAGDVASVDELYGRLSGHLQWSNLRELQKVLRQRGVRLAFLSSENLAADLIAQHAEVRARQLV